MSNEQALRKAFDIEGARQFLASFANWRPDPLNDDRHYRALAIALDYLCDLIGPQALALPTAAPANRASLQSGADARDAELWAPITGFEGAYEISSIGRVRSLDRVDSDNNRRRGRFMVGSPTTKGYMRVSLYQSGVKSDLYVHRLVASAFIPNPNDLPQVNHKDGDPANNEVSNLEWVTNAENLLHARRELEIGVRPIYGISVSDGSRVEFPSLQLAVEAGFIRANIQKCIAGTRKKHKGYTWHDAAIDATIDAAIAKRGA